MKTLEKIKTLTEELSEDTTTLEKIKTLTEELSEDTTKFFKGNNSAGTRARKLAQQLKTELQNLRTEILKQRNKNENV